MKLFALIPTIAVLSLREVTVSGFSISPSARSLSSNIKLHASIQDDEPTENSNNLIQRRTLLTNLLTTSTLLLTTTTTLPTITSAAETIPSVTSSEFDVILKDSAKSILTVELSGPKSETALVKLVDGTIFTISDLVESSTDPRSPLKLVARCRLYKIPVKNTGLTSAVSGLNSVVSEGGKKKKNYMNPRVQEAEKKEKAKRERMAEDERERLEELYLMEGREQGFLKD
eukprot:CAMPEP_0196145280 /NCGR_PEP_ID=MMETSP0910-20130528/19801_1 /TAXON_ID=49265 /ORGANISM="Thalassiosira rotula, Strain GSO102" /LENGTH=228 /DNA_ID=CAMNT_0041407195 /DNA_START=62 /DNA_END=748 /DNA_ORIENTATION=-